MSFCKAAMLAMLLLIGGVAPVCADGASEAFLKRVDELVGWIARHTDYPAALKTAPNFVFMAPADIRHGFSNTSMGYAREKEIVAAQTDKTTILPDSFTLGRDDYVLLHYSCITCSSKTTRRFPAMRSASGKPMCCRPRSSSEWPSRGRTPTPESPPRSLR